MRLIIPGAVLFACIILIGYMLALLNFRVGDIRSQVASMAKSDIGFQETAKNSFDSIHGAIVIALQKQEATTSALVQSTQLQLDKMADVIKALNASADSRLISFTQQVNGIQEEIKAIREEAEAMRGNVQAIRAETSAMKDNVRVMQNNVQSMQGNVQAVRGKLNQKILTEDQARAVQAQKQQVQSQKEELKAATKAAKEQIREEKKKKAGRPLIGF